MTLNTSRSLLEKIGERRALVCVIGMGYVGLPLATVFAEAGLRTIGIDLDESKVNSINSGVSYIREIEDQRLSRITTGESPTLQATCDFDALSDADVAIICVPTPLSKTKDPDLSHIMSAAEHIAKRLHRGMLIVLESTTYPGTTEELLHPYIEKEQLKHGKTDRLRVGEDYFLAFSPERIDPGSTRWNIQNTPKIMGGLTKSCGEVAMALYGCVVQELVPVSSPKIAEMAKLLENTFRSVNIGLVNEFAIMCDHLDVDVWEVIDAAGSKPFGFMKFSPGPGLGGHCIPVDPHYLAWKLRTVNYNARFIQLATEVNFDMPKHVMARISDALNDDGKALKNSKVIILGVTYKPDVDDIREAPALDIIHLLHRKGAVVAFHDPYVGELDLDGLHLECSKLSANTLRESDCVVISTDHKLYDWNWVVENSPLVVDTRNATKNVDSRLGRVVKL